ncbi:histidine phosphatase family protein [Falsiroseomonas sp.]|uniref:histidine phosphatase family protein n=1 Tax=Falsiroseomonas sp. TaxID=2870721 RepID=UPI002733AEDD|nr:histidine phosphatase family protein [Falsiroseomonas sp.]MDP3415916.1 histidine phosphatase family protein [Falsiroseomonas sp.]
MRRRWLLALPALLAGRAEAATVRGEAAAALIAALRRGGVVVVLRHAITDRSQVDRGDLADRAGQRNLSESGRAQSRALGRAFAQLPLGQVLTSPVFRALDTAELAFGARAAVEPRLTADDYTHDMALLAANIAWLRERIRQPSAPDAVDVLVGHIVPLGMVLGRGLSQAEYPEGALAIFAPGGRLLGVLAAETLGEALSPAPPASGTPPPR